LPGGTSALRRAGNSGKNTTNVKSNTYCSITNTAHRPSHILAVSTLNSIQNAADNRHQVSHSTDELNDISAVDKIKDGFQNSGNNTTKLTRLSTNADTKRINDSTGVTSKSLEESIEISVKRTAESRKRSQNTAGESSETTSGHYVDDGGSANIAKHSQAYRRQPASTRGDSKDPSVHSPNTFQLSERESAKRRHCENTTHEHLRGQATTTQDFARSSGKGPKKTQRPDDETRRKREDVNETRDKRVHKTRTQVRETDPVEETKTKADNWAYGTRGSSEGIHTECRAHISPDSIEKRHTGVEETSDQKNNNHPSIKDKEEDYSACQNKKQTHSTGDKTEQAGKHASLKDKAIQRFSNGKQKRTDDIWIEKRKTGGSTEYSGGTKGKTEEGSTEQVEQQHTEAGTSEKLRQDNSSGTMSRRPQVLKITDSASTALRRRGRNKHVSCLYTPLDDQPLPDTFDVTKFNNPPHFRKPCKAAVHV
jgi:hypothetical protein